MLAALDDTSFAVRGAATAELVRRERVGIPALPKALAGPLPLEARRLEKVEAPVRSPEHRLGLRAIRTLDRVGSPEARQVLGSGKVPRKPRGARRRRRHWNG